MANWLKSEKLTADHAASLQFAILARKASGSGFAAAPVWFVKRGGGHDAMLRFAPGITVTGQLAHRLNPGVVVILFDLELFGPVR